VTVFVNRSSAWLHTIWPLVRTAYTLMVIGVADPEKSGEPTLGALTLAW
jgi:hypothetical protein